MPTSRRSTGTRRCSGSPAAAVRREALSRAGRPATGRRRPPGSSRTRTGCGRTRRRGRSTGSSAARRRGTASTCSRSTGSSRTRSSSAVTRSNGPTALSSQASPRKAGRTMTSTSVSKPSASPSTPDTAPADEADLLTPLRGLEFVPRDSLRANDYNPNRVNEENLRLLTQSILSNGWTLPTAARPDGTISDGFHRGTVSGREPLLSRLSGLVPVVRVRHSDKAGDVYGTITHNRARGTHLLEPMKAIVAELLA